MFAIIFMNTYGIDVFQLFTTTTRKFKVSEAFTNAH